MGPLFRFDEVLGNFGWFVWEQFLAGHQEVVHRSCDYVEWLLGDCAPELAELTVRRVFKGKDWSAEVGDWIGPRTRAELRRTDWAPQTLQ